MAVGELSHVTIGNRLTGGAQRRFPQRRFTSATIIISTVRGAPAGILRPTCGRHVKNGGSPSGICLRCASSASAWLHSHCPSPQSSPAPAWAAGRTHPAASLERSLAHWPTQPLRCAFRMRSSAERQIQACPKSKPNRYLVVVCPVRAPSSTKPVWMRRFRPACMPRLARTTPKSGVSIRSAELHRLERIDGLRAARYVHWHKCECRCRARGPEPAPGDVIHHLLLLPRCRSLHAGAPHVLVPRSPG